VVNDKCVVCALLSARCHPTGGMVSTTHLLNLAPARAPAGGGVAAQVRGH
jgi:hypothetical protein